MNGDHTESALVDGASFTLDSPDGVVALWGDSERALWTRGEALMICGPQGVGKTTLAQQLVLSLVGIGDRNLLGLPVEPLPEGRRGLYLAMDRPAQAARSFRRMVAERDRATLAERLLVHRGPLQQSFLAAPEHLIGLARAHSVSVIVIDSLKDVSPGLAKDEVGAAYNIARQRTIAAGVDVVELHHQRKGTSDNKQPRHLDDVYGSVWLTSGAGSVVILWGEAGDPVLELRHLKAPADEIGPCEVYVDHAKGTLAVEQKTTIRGLLEAATNGGITAQEAAAELYGDSSKGAKREKARRALEKLVQQGHAVKVPQSDQNAPAVYRPASRRHSGVTVRDRSRDGVTDPHATPSHGVTQGVTDPHGTSTAPSPYRGETERDREANADAELARLAEKFPDLEQEAA